LRAPSGEVATHKVSCSTHVIPHWGHRRGK